MEKIQHQTKKLADKAALYNKLNQRVEKEIRENIEKYFYTLENYPKMDIGHRLDRVSELLSLNWKLNKNIFFIKNQLKYYKQRVEEGEAMNARA